MSRRFTRREFAKTIGAAGAMSGVPLSLALGQPPPSGPTATSPTPHVHTRAATTVLPVEFPVGLCHQRLSN